MKSINALKRDRLKILGKPTLSRRDEKRLERITSLLPDRKNDSLLAASALLGVDPVCLARVLDD